MIPNYLFSSNALTLIFFDTGFKPQDLVSNLSILSRGTIREKLLWVFRLYDTDQDGVISLLDLKNILTSIYLILDPHTKNLLLSHRSSTDVGLTSSSFPQNIKVSSSSSTPDKNMTMSEDKKLRKISISFSPTTPSIETFSKDPDFETSSKHTDTRQNLPPIEETKPPGKRRISIASIRRFSSRPSQDHTTLSAVISQHANQLFKVGLWACNTIMSMIIVAITQKFLDHLIVWLTIVFGGIFKREYE